MSRLRRRARPDRRTAADAQYLTVVVMVLQAMALLVLIMMHREPAVSWPWMELLWAAGQKPAFYFVVLVFAATPVLTILAFRVSGRHRWWLLAAWGLFVVTLYTNFAPRLAAMLRVIEQQVKQGG
ncbi:MAG TPA: hypothetical protein VF184_09630 [Phycisphaeraceae bacterium]